MKSNKIYLVLFLIFTFITGCELVDPTGVNNPAITQEKLFADATGGAEPLLTGLEFAMSDAVARIAIYTENVSDNYVNTSTFLSTLNDNPRSIFPGETVLNDPRELYYKCLLLNSLADFGLNTVIPKDQTATRAQTSRVYFFRGMAKILLSENFSAFPLKEKGAPVKAEDAIKSAIEDLIQAGNLDNTGDNAIEIKLALARAYRIAGNKIKAAEAANAAISLSADHAFLTQYDPTNLVNQLNLFTVTRPQNDMQPLPRLDFLDPKFADPASTDPIPVLKAEEAYLILAEVSLMDGNLNEAKSQMVNAINLAITRASLIIRDRDPRKNRPNDNDFKCKSDASSSEESGLIFKRSSSNVNSYPISYTHLRESDLNSLTGREEIFRVLYLLRQEIFFSEGRRMSDLGIRLPVMLRQMETNPGFTAGGPGTAVIVPNYIPQGKEMDEFTTDAVNKIITMKHDMNKTLSLNINSVSPFH